MYTYITDLERLKGKYSPLFAFICCFVSDGNKMALNRTKVMISGFYRLLTFSNKEAKLNDIFKINSEFAPVLRSVYYLY